MATPPLEATVRHATGWAIVDLRGEVDARAERVLSDAYAEAASHNPARLLLNFAEVVYINSTGIALIVGLLAQARRTGRRVLTYGLSDHYVEIFQITRLADFMSMFPDETSALASATSRS